MERVLRALLASLDNTVLLSFKMSLKQSGIGIVFDIDGVICHDWQLIPGADAAIRRVKELQIPHVL
jgi:ribonucleotide monophosphatase NagD (HAD superfamily)